MPELPEVETIRRQIAPALIGKMITHVRYNRPNIRFALPPEMPQLVVGRVINGVERRGKYLLIGVDGAGQILLHLGMSGRVLIEDNAPPLCCALRSPSGEGWAGGGRGRGFLSDLESKNTPLSHAARDSSPAGGEPFTAGAFYYDTQRSTKHDHVMMTLNNCTLIYNDPRRFGMMDFIPLGQNTPHPLLANMGHEPWSDACTPQWLFNVSRNRSTSLKALLLDQTHIAGIGNIYASEALHSARLSPFAAASMLTFQQAEDLLSAVRLALEKGIRLGGASIRDFSQADGEKGAMQDEFLVYGRDGQPCHSCGAPIIKATQNGRSTFWCGGCQV